MSELIETMASAIWENQCAQMKNQDGINVRRTWRDENIPNTFWNGYANDARAALSAIEAAGFVVTPRERKRETIDRKKRSIGLRKWALRPAGRKASSAPSQ